MILFQLSLGKPKGKKQNETKQKMAAPEESSLPKVLREKYIFVPVGQVRKANFYCGR